MNKLLLSFVALLVLVFFIDQAVALENDPIIVTDQTIVIPGSQNDSKQNAVSLDFANVYTTGGSGTATVGTSIWRKINITEKGTIVVILEYSVGSDFNLGFYNACSTTNFCKVNEFGNIKSCTMNIQPGEYFIEVKRQSTNGQYSLDVDQIETQTIADANVSKCPIACYTSANCGTDDWIDSSSCSSNDVFQNYQTFICNNPGTVSSSCSSTTIPKLKQDCGDTNAGAWSTNKCDVNRVIKTRIVHNKGCDLGSCFANDSNETQIVETCQYGCSNGNCLPKPNCYTNADCGTDSYIGSQYCSSNNVFQLFRTNTCNNPGTQLANCTIFDLNQLKTDCGTTTTGTWSNNYCIDKNVAKTRIVHNKGCLNGNCYSNDTNETTIVQACAYGCKDGNCFTPVCSKNLDCGTDGLVGTTFCKTNDVYQLFKAFECSLPGTASAKCLVTDSNLMKQDCGDTNSSAWSANKCDGNKIIQTRVTHNRGCLNGNCFVNDTNETQTIQTCQYGCSNGACVIPACYSDSNCGTNDWTGNPVCQSNDVYQGFNEFTCNNPGTILSSCSGLTSLKLKTDCGDTNYGAWENNYCDGNTIKRNRTVQNNGCLNGACYSNNTIETEIIENCQYGCNSSSACRSFGDPILYCPTKMIDSNYTFRWNGGYYTSSYNFQLSSTKNFSPACMQTTITRNYYALSGIYDHLFYCNSIIPSSDGNFYAKLLATDSNGIQKTADICMFDLNKNCTAHATTKCSSGRYVYWVDACGATEERKDDCNVTSTEAWSANYCVDKNIVKTRVVHNKGCAIGACFANDTNETQTVQSCAYGCSDGNCIAPPKVCNTNNDCTATEFCKKTIGACNNTGVCQAKPSACILVTDQVCGCDGKTYDSACNANKLGINVLSNGACQYTCTTNTDCGTNGFIGNAFCRNTDVYQIFRTFLCNSPGTLTAACLNNDENKLKESCGTTTNEEWNAPVCDGNQLVKTRTVHNKGCSVGTCYANDSEEKQTVQSCQYGCENNSCVTPVCVQDSDCGISGFFGDKYCKENNVYQKYESFSCQNAGTSSSNCNRAEEEKQTDACSKGCFDAKCITNELVLYCPQTGIKSDYVFSWNNPNYNYFDIQFSYTPTFSRNTYTSASLKNTNSFNVSSKFKTLLSYAKKTLTSELFARVNAKVNGKVVATSNTCTFTLKTPEPPSIACPTNPITSADSLSWDKGDYSKNIQLEFSRSTDFKTKTTIKLPANPLSFNNYFNLLEKYARASDNGKAKARIYAEDNTGAKAYSAICEIEVCSDVVCTQKKSPCIINSDCGIPGVLKQYCDGNTLYHQNVEYFCHASWNTAEECTKVGDLKSWVKNCPNGCENGACLSG